MKRKLAKGLTQCFPTWGPRPTRGKFDCLGGQFENGLDMSSNPMQC